MTTQTEEAPVPPPQVVGNAFVEQYYSILHQSPELVHRFYQDSSVLSRPEPDGSMSLVSTMQGINEKIISLDYKNFRVEILSADAQTSYKEGVMVVVTGCLTGNDNVQRKFTQSFFLAPQDKGYFVLNDVFRYVDEQKSDSAVPVPANGASESAPAAPITSDHDVNHVAENATVNQTASVDTETNAKKEVSQPIENGNVSVTDKVVAADHTKDSSRHETSPCVEQTSACNVQENTPKKSFASIVNALKDNTAPFQVMRFSPVKPVEQPRAAVAKAPPAEVAPVTTNSVAEKKNEQPAKAYAIFVANLPMNATVEQLEQVFKRFGAIKNNGIQVRSNKQQGSCFGFVEFEFASSMQSALETSPIILDNRRLSIEERRANNERSRYPSGRGSNGSGYRNDNFRGQGNFNGGRGYGRNDSENGVRGYGRNDSENGARGYGRNERNDSENGARGYGRNDFEKRAEQSGWVRGSGGRNGETRGAYQNGGRGVARQAVRVE